MTPKQYELAKKIQDELNIQKRRRESISMFQDNLRVRAKRKERNMLYHDLVSAAQDGLLGHDLPIEMVQEIVKYQLARTSDEINKLEEEFGGL